MSGDHPSDDLERALDRASRPSLPPGMAERIVAKATRLPQHGKPAEVHSISGARPPAITQTFGGKRLRFAAAAATIGVLTGAAMMVMGPAGPSRPDKLDTIRATSTPPLMALADEEIAPPIPPQQAIMPEAKPNLAQSHERVSTQPVSAGKQDATEKPSNQTNSGSENPAPEIARQSALASNEDTDAEQANYPGDSQDLADGPPDTVQRPGSMIGPTLPQHGLGYAGSAPTAVQPGGVSDTSSGLRSGNTPSRGPGR